MTNVLAILCAIVALQWTPALARKSEYQEVWDSLGRTGDQAWFLPAFGINMKLTVHLIELSDYDEKTSSLSVYYWVSMIWKDPTIKWNATSTGVDSIRVPAHMIWTPDVVPYVIKSHKMTFKTYAVVDNSGEVIYVPAYSTRVTCKDKKTKKKGDGFKGRRKQCVLKLGSWVFDANSLNITSYKVDKTLLGTDGLKGSGWTFDGLKVDFQTKYYPCCSEPYQSLSVRLNIKSSYRMIERTEEESVEVAVQPDDKKKKGDMVAWVEDEQEKKKSEDGKRKDRKEDEEEEEEEEEE